MKSWNSYLASLHQVFLCSENRYSNRLFLLGIAVMIKWVNPGKILFKNI